MLVFQRKNPSKYPQVYLLFQPRSARLIVKVSEGIPFSVFIKIYPSAGRQLQSDCELDVCQNVFPLPIHHESVSSARDDERSESPTVRIMKTFRKNLAARWIQSKARISNALNARGDPPRWTKEARDGKSESYCLIRKTGILGWRANQVRISGRYCQRSANTKKVNRCNQNKTQAVREQHTFPLIQTMEHRSNGKHNDGRRCQRIWRN